MPEVCILVYWCCSECKSGIISSEVSEVRTNRCDVYFAAGELNTDGWFIALVMACIMFVLSRWSGDKPQIIN